MSEIKRQAVRLAFVILFSLPIPDHLPVWENNPRRPKEKNLPNRLRIARKFFFGELVCG
jgi:hypothetical protein